MSVIYYKGAEASDDVQADAITNLRNFMVDFIDGLKNGDTPSIRLDLKSFKPGLLETVVTIVDISFQDGEFRVDGEVISDIGATTSVNVISGVLAS